MLLSLFEEGFPTTVRNPSRSLEPCFALLRPNVGFKPAFKPVAINIYVKFLGRLQVPGHHVGIWHGSQGPPPTPQVLGAA